MKLGFVSAIVPELTLDQVLAFAAAERFACVEIMCWPVGKAERKFAGVTHIDVTSLGKEQADDIHSLCAKHNVSVSGLGYYPNALDPDPEVSTRAVEHLKKVIAGAAKLGLKTVNTFVGRDWTKSVEANWPRFLEIWKPIIAFAEDQDVKVGIENCPMFFTGDEWPGGKNLATTPVIWRRMFNDIDSKHFGLNYDPSHFVLQHMDPASPLREFQSKLFHCHAKDIKFRRDRMNDTGIFSHPLEWHQPRIPGYGEMDWANYMGALMETTYRGPVCIEVEDGTFGTSLEGRKKAVKVARNVLEPYFV